MKDAVITVRIPSRTRKRIEILARREGRSLSQEVERLIERAMAAGPDGSPASRFRGPRSLGGVLRGGRVPTLAEFREVRGLLSASFTSSGRTDVQRRR